MKKILSILLGLSASVAFAADSVTVKTIFMDGKTDSRTVELRENPKGVRSFILKVSEVSENTKFIDITANFSRAKVGDGGYFMAPTGQLTKFIERKDDTVFVPNAKMSMFGSLTPAGANVAIVKKLRYGYGLAIAKKGADYTQSIRLKLDGRKPYEDLVVDYIRLDGDDANYSGMARAYRNFRLANAEVAPIREKMKTRPALEYCVKNPEIRIRQGWKPAPPKILEQTPENEPPMKVAVTFERVGKIIDELKAQNVGGAQICLVGWNVSGHDGRYPQMFPVEPKLGGEAKLRELIKKSQADGFQIVCHTNSTDAYSIADSWNKDYIAKKPDGSLSVNKTPWSGGTMYNLCWKCSYQHYGEHDLKKVFDLGFKGMHYIDVISCVPPLECFDANHPVNPKEAAAYINKIFQYCNSTFGGSMSEGGYDFCFGNVDSALYISFSLLNSKPKFADAEVPLWQIVYNGIVLSCPGPAMVNYTIKEPRARLKNIEFGGRPAFYFHSKFRDTTNWMGDTDLLATTDADIKSAVAKIKEGYDEYQKLNYLQLEYMESHVEIAKDVFCVKYSDGSEIVCNYTGSPFEHKGRSIAPFGYRLYKPSIWRKFIGLF